MGPDTRIRGGKVVVSDNLYTAILLISVGIVLSTVVLVAYQCYTQYDTIFKIPQ